MSEEVTAEGGHGAVPTTGVETGLRDNGLGEKPTRRTWPLYEVFVRGKRGLNHVHVGSLHAADDEMALHNARDVYTRRGEAGCRELDNLVASLEIDIVAFDARHVAEAQRAFRMYGKGRHRAALNFGDCLAYALAKALDMPLLFKGNDFSLTDIKRVR